LYRRAQKLKKGDKVTDKTLYFDATYPSRRVSKYLYIISLTTVQRHFMSKYFSIDGDTGFY